ncbi:alpha/beta fold hydrolase [Flexibacterium corallicola]|uniref:alpha/beta fold hydrolase n=1 Tax=Flexibacterium corallicola TaxID=3037259 RepID=UPI00286F6810|nr:alpha/beta fold hydrolase [Pseudovibrio sp. M1P-2-3]
MDEIISTQTSCLPYSKAGNGKKAPAIFIHGFGSDATSWRPLQTTLEAKRETIAFDLPGHGRALNWPEIGSPGSAAKSVASSLKALNLHRVHLVGHSMGGAIACLIAMRSPEIVASLTLIGPGGFGEEINGAVLQQYAASKTAEAQDEVLHHFFGKGHKIPWKISAHLANERARKGAIEALEKVHGAFLKAEGQGVLPIEKLGDMSFPIKLLWGTDDQILPYSQTKAIPANIALHSFKGAGHMLQYEHPRQVASLILENTR